MKKLFLLTIVSIITILYSTGCSTVPYTGRSQFLLTSESEEQQMGVDAWRQICSQEKLSYNSQLNSAVRRVGTDIANAANKPSYAWEFKVFDSSTANAFCLPGGKIAVYSGIFKYMANDAELATVVGHEVGHAIARHGGERVSHGMLQQAGQEVIAATVEDADGKDLWLIAYGAAANVGAVLPYSREHEYEADRIGMILMAKAGYNPRAAIEFWKKFSSLSDTNEFTEFFSTHPMGEKRVEEMYKNLAEAMKYYNACSNKKDLGYIYKNGVPTSYKSQPAASPTGSSQKLQEKKKSGRKLGWDTPVF